MVTKHDADYQRKRLACMKKFGVRPVSSGRSVPRPPTQSPATTSNTMADSGHQADEPWLPNRELKRLFKILHQGQGASENEIREWIDFIHKCIERGLSCEDWRDAFPSYRTYSQYAAETKAERKAEYRKQGWRKEQDLTVTSELVQELNDTVQIPAFECRDIMNLCRQVVAKPVSGKKFIRHYTEHTVNGER